MLLCGRGIALLHHPKLCTCEPDLICVHTQTKLAHVTFCTMLWYLNENGGVDLDRLHHCFKLDVNYWLIYDFIIRVILQNSLSVYKKCGSLEHVGPPLSKKDTQASDLFFIFLLQIIKTFHTFHRSTFGYFSAYNPL